MNCLIVSTKRSAAYRGGQAACMLLVLLLCCSLTAPAQNPSQPKNPGAAFSIRATHLLGFEDTKDNCNGTLSIQNDVLQFQTGSRTGAQVKIASLRDVFLGGESKQVGGLPMTLGKAAAPYGGGRVVSLFAHKKYDTLTLQYVDRDEGVHGALFQLNKGQGELVRDQLVARGVSVSSGKDQPTKQSTAEVTHEN